MGLSLLLLVGSGCTPEPEITNSPAASGPGDVGSTVSGRAARASRGYPSVIQLVPAVTSDDAASPSEPVVMDQFGRSFEPGLLVARVGQPVQFSNSEDELHNVHVIDPRTGATVFNVATLPFNSYTYRFELAGAYEVSCNTHAGMFAHLLVTETPYFVAADDDGSFSLSGIPPGSYRITVWNADEARRSEHLVEIGEGRTELDLSPPNEPEPGS